MSDIVFGFLIEDTKKFPVEEIADVLEDAAEDEEWSWVLWELNHAYFGIIKGSLTLKGRISQERDIEVISLGEAIEEAEDGRSKWIVPAKSSNGSVHELAQRKIRNFIAATYDETSKLEVEDVVLTKPKERILAPISSRRKFSGNLPSSTKSSNNTGSESLLKPTSSTNTEKEKPAGGTIARKSRRNA